MFGKNYIVNSRLNKNWKKYNLIRKEIKNNCKMIKNLMISSFVIKKKKLI